MMVAIDLVWQNTMEVNGYRQLFVYQNIILCVQQKKETHTGLEQV